MNEQENSNPEIVKFLLPEGAVVKGVMYNTYDLDYLSEDLVEIRLPSGITIDVGWYPEGERPGVFQIALFKQYWRNQIIAPIETSNLPDVVATVERLAEQYSKRVISYSASTESTARVQSEDLPILIELAAAA